LTISESYKTLTVVIAVKCIFLFSIFFYLLGYEAVTDAQLSSVLAPSWRQTKMLTFWKSSGSRCHCVYFV